MRTAGIILAAGRSSRMGRDKALLPYQSSTFLENLAGLFHEFFSPVIVVLGHHAAEIERAVRLPDGVQVIRNEDYGRGMLSSLQTAIAALPDDVEAAAFTLIDHPGVRRETIAALISAAGRAGKLLAIPRYGEKRGHPVFLRRQVLEEIAALPIEASPKDVIRTHRAKTAFVDVEDPAVIRDVDLPEQYHALRQPGTGG